MANEIKRTINNDIYNALTSATSPGSANPFVTTNDIIESNLVKNISATHRFINNTNSSVLVNTGWRFIEAPSFTALSSFGGAEFEKAPQGGIKYVGDEYATFEMNLNLTVKSNSNSTTIDDILLTMAVTVPSGNTYIQPNLISRVSVGKNIITDGVVSNISLFWVEPFVKDTIVTPRVLTLSNSLNVTFSDMQFSMTKLNQNP